MSTFEKMKFREIINGDKTEFFINDKSVSQETYDSILNDNSLYTLPPLPLPNVKNNNQNNAPNTTQNSNNYTEIQIDGDEYQELLTMVNDIKEMSVEDAIVGLKFYLDAIKTETQLEALSQAYEELGNGMIKTAIRLENKLEDYMSQFYVEDEE